MRTSTPTTQAERDAWRAQWDYAGHAENRAVRLLDDVDALTATLAEAKRDLKSRLAAAVQSLDVERAAHAELRAAVAAHARICRGPHE